MNLRRLIFVLIPLSAVGCGSDNKPLTPTEYASQYAQEVCNAVSPACLVPTASCTAVQIQGRTAQAQAAALANRFFESANAQTCLGKVSSTYGRLNQGAVALKGADYEAVMHVCDLVYRGLNQANQPCAVEADCVDGLICDTGGGKNLCGVKTQVLQGAGCGNAGEICPVGYYCGTSATTRALTCQTKVGLGGACSDAVPCLENLRCSANVCIAQSDYGEDCTVDQDCSSGFCEPFAFLCGDDIRFANGNPACLAMGGS